MFAQSDFPTQFLSSDEHDLYHSKGWFRMGQSIFRCTYLNLNNQVYRVFWLRVVLENIANNKKLRKLSKLNSKFNIKVQKATVTPEKEALYRIYKGGIAFEPSDSLESLLYSGSEINIFDTWEIVICDGEKLIAVGYFDIGNKGAAGINCFYDPAYKKHSLGKYLIYQKMLYCRNRQVEYFYLGYFAPGCKAFNYKLDIAKESLEYFDISSQKWYGIHTWDSVKGSLDENVQQLKDFQQQLDKVNIENRLFQYSYFQANQFRELQGFELFDYSMFVNCFQFDPEVVNPIVVYDIRDQHYHLLRCISVAKTGVHNDDTEDYTAHFLKIAEVIYSTKNATELADMISRSFVRGKVDAE
jgi:arginyl-tRNA--protein-N-Asp/Glu arginylyltransferase